MKTALLIDWLNTKKGGGEAVLIELAQMYPDADIFTLVYNKELYPELNNRVVKTSFLQKMPRWLKKRSRYLLPLIPNAIEQLDLSEYDLVISCSSAWVKSAITKPETTHICYCYSPTRMIWDYWPKYIEEQHVGPLRRAAIHWLTSRIRVWDYLSSSRVDYWIPISDTVSDRIKKFYRAKPEPVIFPGAEISKFETTSKKEDYFVSVGSLATYKRIDIAIEACNQTGDKLVIAGDGPDRSRLEKIAGPNIKFLGRVSDEKRRDILAKAKAFIFPGLEDFGITPIEAMASGTPVIAYGKGGVSETVIDGKTGIFFDEISKESLTNAIRRFGDINFKKEDLISRANEFSTKRFEKEFMITVDRLHRRHQEYVKAK